MEAFLLVAFQLLVGIGFLAVVGVVSFALIRGVLQRGERPDEKNPSKGNDSVP